MITVEHYRSENRIETLSKLLKLISINEDSYEDFLPLFIRLVNNSNLGNVDRLCIGFIISSTTKINNENKLSLLQWRLRHFKDKGISGLLFQYDKKLLIKLIEEIKFCGIKKNN